MNKVILMGRLTKDPEILRGNTTVAKYSLAVDRKYKDDETDFFNLVSFGKQAEFVNNYLHKGSKILISGRIENNTYTNKEGERKTTTQIIVEDVEFAESKNNTSSEFVSIANVGVEELPFS